MNLDAYPVVSGKKHGLYEFVSKGPKGTIKKAVSYQRVGNNIYNLAFGDWNEIEQKIDDSARSNNNDRQKVIATVASTVLDFMKENPDANIIAEGSTPARTRLYQIGISKNLHYIRILFNIYGYYDDQWEPFSRRKNYAAFLLKSNRVF